MANTKKAKGTKFEVGVLNYLRSLGHFAERLTQSGKNDQGDVVTIIAGKTYVFECKAHKSLDLPEFWRQACAEAENYAKARGLDYTPPAFVVAKRRNASIEDAWVITSLERWVNERSAETATPLQEDSVEKKVSNTEPEMGKDNGN